MIEDISILLLHLTNQAYVESTEYIMKMCVVSIGQV